MTCCKEKAVVPPTSLLIDGKVQVFFQLMKIVKKNLRVENVRILFRNYYYDFSVMAIDTRKKGVKYEIQRKQQINYIRSKKSEMSTSNSFKYPILQFMNLL